MRNYRHHSPLLFPTQLSLTLHYFHVSFAAQPPPKSNPGVVKNVSSLTVSINAKSLVATSERMPLTETDEEEHAKIDDWPRWRT